MKRTALCLWLLALTSAGCFTLPWSAPEANLPRPRAAMIAEPPPPVKAEDVREDDPREAVRRLEKEIRFDEDAAGEEGPQRTAGEKMP